MDSLKESIERQSFDIGRRGYEKDQVDQFLTDLAVSISTLEENLRDALIQKRELERRRVGKAEVEDSVESAYVAAAEAKHKLLTDAEERASVMLRDAEIESARLLAEPQKTADRARKDAEGLLLQAQSRLDTAGEEADGIRAEAESIRADASRLVETEVAKAREEGDRIRSDATLESERVLATAQSEAEAVLGEATSQASEVYETERRRSIDRLAKSRDEYEDLARKLRDLKEATGDMLTNALRDHEAIRVVLDDSPIEVS
ncbi:MAG: DivIVA domain-containing protein [Actinomycetota bacterium]|nr:DivIVA domain-containing protein [Actinomycetota bacterium]